MTYQRPYEFSEEEIIKDPLYYEMGNAVLKNKPGIIDPLKAAEEETIGFIILKRSTCPNYQLTMWIQKN